jgi:drug/metabolite transporter (DMT)-like permease
MTNKQRIAYSACAVLWGTSFFTIRYAQFGEGAFPPIPLGALRFSLAFLLVVALRIFFPSLAGTTRRRDVILLGTLGVLNGIGIALLCTAENTISSGAAAILTSLSVVLVAVYAALRKCTKNSIQAVIAALMGVFGVYLLFKDQSHASLHGIWLMVVYAAIIALFNQGVKQFGSSSSNLDVLLLVFGPMAVTLWLINLLMGWQPLPVVRLTPSLVLVYMATCTTVLPYLLYAGLMKALSTVQVISMNLAMPAVALVCDFFWEREARIGKAGYFGAALITAAIFACLRHQEAKTVAATK